MNITEAGAFSFTPISQSTRTISSVQNGAAEQQDVSSLAKDAVAPQDGALAVKKNSNMMQGLFFKADFEQSRYLKSALSDLQDSNAFSDRMGLLLGSMSAQFEFAKGQIKLPGGGDTTYLAATLMKNKMDSAVKQTTEQEVSEEAEENLEQIRDEIDERATEATENTASDQGAPTSETDSETAASQDAGNSNDAVTNLKQTRNALDEGAAEAIENTATDQDAANAAPEGAQTKNNAEGALSAEAAAAYQTAANRNIPAALSVMV